MKVPVGDVNELRKAALLATERIADATGRIDDPRWIDAKIVCCNVNQPLLEFVAA
jgi:hypothetical protein